MRMYAPLRRSGEDMKAIVVILILGLIALGATFPVSAAGQGGNGNGMMLHNGDGSTGTGVCPNPDCPQADCPNNQTPPRDGTGMQYGKNLKR
ncbi:hypothetical protein Mhun_2665 [Methanospirillum hungatei JF-1]|uniref:Uncharacterized protein n=2 Tax=Methanospirillum hungatei TaxID=2203 RepID=Q2FTB6_METHJ|nr:hypothetical protein Mhun_2665 [Methanospirillum hungatei JF-1]